MNDPIFSLWVYLSRTPLLWLTTTLIVYAAADRLSAASGRHPLANPVLHSVWAIGLLLWLTNTPYAHYFEGAQFVHFMLGPATVALALPLYQHRHLVWRAAAPMIAALLAGSIAAVVSAAGIAWLFGAPPALIASIAPKSVTAGVAMGIAEKINGDVALTAVIVVSTGVLGAIVVTPLMQFMRIKDWRARGFAAGLAAHGIGTARAFQVNTVAGAFAAVAMALNAVATAIIVPFAAAIFSGG